MTAGRVAERTGCQSEPGAGTTFRIYLPLAKEAVQRVLPTETPPLRRGRETLLVAEDDPLTMDVTTAMLKEFGYKVITAGNGEEAVAIFRDNWRGIDLCVLDVVMPKMRGREALKEIRRINPGAKVLFMSGYSTDITKPDHLLEMGADLIMKPLEIHSFLGKVRGVLDR